MPPATGARCGIHPEMAAVATCARCGTFLCGDCTEVVGESPYCAPCLDVLRKSAKPSWVVQVALGLNVLGVACLPCSMALPLPSLVAGLAGVLLGSRELRRIRDGHGPERGITQARVARGLGYFNLTLSLAWLLMLTLSQYLP
ncbi:hypothetical protein [Pyxidicoccus xibeiensis]|uniref:hypothetical protein n=1 Tax=Pyxidicoccus xibeiensis TaxID=2906759 RepID=UPI0020A6DE75|nr:hypothetical protein [Pyxidicoccus xibeiensis]MCP3136384.1 hypothetical protein [Pyxidicoccus xibeiensis]